MCHDTVCHQAEDTDTHRHTDVVTQNLKPSDVEVADLRLWQKILWINGSAVVSMVSMVFDVTHLIELHFHLSAAADNNPP